MKKLSLVFLLFVAGIVCGQSVKGIYTATMPNGTTWIGQKSPDMPPEAKLMKGKDSFEFVTPAEESNHAKLLRKNRMSSIYGKSGNGGVVFTGAMRGNSVSYPYPNEIEQAFESSDEPNTGTETDEPLVYLSDTGSKYHARADCSQQGKAVMTIHVPLSEAINQKKTKCSKCGDLIEKQRDN